MTPIALPVETLAAEHLEGVEIAKPQTFEIPTGVGAGAYIVTVAHEYLSVRIKGMSERGALTWPAVLQACERMNNGGDGSKPTATMPSTADQAASEMYAALRDYEWAQKQCRARTKAWADEDKMSSRVRGDAIRRLMANGTAMSKSEADKRASDDPEYAALKDRLVDLSAAKDEALDEVNAAKARMDVAMAFLNSLTRTVAVSAPATNRKGAA